MENFKFGKQGFDVSFYQDDDETKDRKIDFRMMYAWGADFVIIRAGQGEWVDEDFSDNWAAARVSGLKRAAYWFYDPRVEPKRQAALFASLVAADKPEGRLWVDLEFPASWGGNYAAWQHWKVFIEELKRLTGLRIGIYSANWWWQPNAVLKGADLAYFSQYPLWAAQYRTSVEGVTLPKGWDRCMIWQDGTPAIGYQVGAESIEIDHNYFNSTFNFEDEFGPGGHVEPPPPSGGTMQYKVVWSNGVTRREGPSTAYPSPANTPAYAVNTIVEVVEDNIPDATDRTNANKVWVKFADGLYGAREYPNSSNVPSTRMVRVEPAPAPAPKIAKAMIYDDQGNLITTLYTQP